MSVVSLLPQSDKMGEDGSEGTLYGGIQKDRIGCVAYLFRDVRVIV